MFYQMFFILLMFFCSPTFAMENFEKEPQKFTSTLFIFEPVHPKDPTFQQELKNILTKCELNFKKASPSYNLASLIERNRVRFEMNIKYRLNRIYFKDLKGILEDQSLGDQPTDKNLKLVGFKIDGRYPCTYSTDRNGTYENYTTVHPGYPELQKAIDRDGRDVWAGTSAWYIAETWPKELYIEFIRESNTHLAGLINQGNRLQEPSVIPDGIINYEKPGYILGDEDDYASLLKKACPGFSATGMADIQDKTDGPRIVVVSYPDRSLSPNKIIKSPTKKYK